MKKPFDVTTMESEIAELVREETNPDTNDPLRLFAGVDRTPRRDVEVPTSEDIPPRSANDYADAAAEDAINPSHYRKHPSGIECIEITRHMNFNVGNAIKYLWRCMEKGDPVENLKKAQWYIDDEIRRLQGSR